MNFTNLTCWFKYVKKKKLFVQYKCHVFKSKDFFTEIFKNKIGNNNKMTHGLVMESLVKILNYCCIFFFVTLATILVATWISEMHVLLWH